MKCTGCGQESPPGARFCAGCGARLVAVCSACGAELPPNARFCPQCGQLFVDVSGFTALSARLDPEDVHAVARHAWVPREEAESQAGLLRSRSVAPPPSPDGMIRIVEIVGLDRQACGGTHLASTGRSRPIRILKIDNKGRHNRRVRYGLAS